MAGTLARPSSVLWATRVELLAEGGVELRHAVAVDVAPQRRDAVEVLAAVEVDEEAAVAPRDDERRLGGVGLHRRERVPDVVAVPLFEFFAGGHGQSGSKPGAATGVGGISRCWGDSLSRYVRRSRNSSGVLTMPAGMGD